MDTFKLEVTNVNVLKKMVIFVGDDSVGGVFLYESGYLLDFITFFHSIRNMCMIIINNYNNRNDE